MHRDSTTRTLEIAWRIASQAHAGQLDKGGRPYIEHPLAVAGLVSSEDEKAVALLHDVVEDSAYSLDDLLDAGIPSHIVDAVDSITKRDGESYDGYLVRVTANTLACTVKLADMTHNSDISRIPHPTQNDYDRVERYKRSIALLKQ